SRRLLSDFCVPAHDGISLHLRCYGQGPCGLDRAVGRRGLRRDLFRYGRHFRDLLEARARPVDASVWSKQRFPTAQILIFIRLRARAQRRAESWKRGWPPTSRYFSIARTHDGASRPRPTRELLAASQRKTVHSRIRYRCRCTLNGPAMGTWI